jgi:bacillithiol biosynthesis deacetylase BshB2
MERHVLVVLPHPDDETFGVGGTIASYAQQGVPITYACGTLGQMGRNMGKPFFATRETLPKVREKELEDACKVLGIRDVRHLGLRDKTIEFEDPDVVADKVLALVEEIRPSLVITHYPGHGVHPDHNALGTFTIRALKRLPEADRPVVHAHAITRNREEALGAPDVVLQLTDPMLNVKLDAIRAHRSQSEAMISRFTGDENALTEFEAQMRRNFSREVLWTYPLS